MINIRRGGIMLFLAKTSRAESASSLSPQVRLARRSTIWPAQRYSQPSTPPKTKRCFENRNRQRMQRQDECQCFCRQVCTERRRLRSAVLRAEQTFDDRQIAFDDTLVALYQSAGPSPHHRRARWLVHEAGNMLGQVNAMAHPYGRAFPYGGLGNAAVVLHVWPKENRLAPGRRLEDVVAAAFDKTAADKDKMSQTVEPWQIADGIDHGNVIGLPFAEARPKLRRVTTAVNQGANDLEPFKVARRDHKKHIASSFAQPAIAVEQLLVFSRMRASGDQQYCAGWQGVTTVREGRCFELAERLSEFQIARHADLDRLDADTNEAFGVGVGLNADMIEQRENRLEQTPPLDPAQRNTPVHEHHGNLSPR